MKNAIQIKKAKSVMNAIETAMESANIFHLSSHDDKPIDSWVAANVYKVTGPDSAIVTATVVLIDEMERKTSICQNFEVKGNVVQTLRTVALINSAKQ